MRVEVRVIQSQDLDTFNELVTDAANTGWYINTNSFTFSDEVYSILSHKHITDEPAPSDEVNTQKPTLFDRIMCGWRIK